MSQAINEASNIISGDYGHLRITYRRLMYTWTVTVYSGPTRIDELCGTWDNPQAAWAEARRIARAAYEGMRTADIIAAKPSELILGAVKDLLDTVPAGKHRQVRPTLAGAHLAPLADVQKRALRLAGENLNRTVYAGQVTRPTLRALARKGYGTLNYQTGMGRRRVIDSLTLNKRGLDHLAAATVAA
jgi:hypothetical protein